MPSNSSVPALAISHLGVRNAADVYALFQKLGYDSGSPEPFEGADLDAFGFDPVDSAGIRRVYIVGDRDTYRVYLVEVDDLQSAHLRGLAWTVLQRGSALLVVTADYREVVFVDPRFAGAAIKSGIRVNKLKVISADPTRHDLDTLNAIHAYHRSGDQIYAAQAEAFNVNVVTRRFYAEYRTYCDKLCAAAQTHNRGVREFQDADKLHAFAQRLLGRLMFVYFLQRKGWIGGRPKFLTEYFCATMLKHTGERDGETFDYYAEVLMPLFFATFNQQRPDNATQWAGIQIPYLNGGLFDPTHDPQGTILLPDSLFDPNSSEGILAFFNRYNFTVSEDTPLEQDVAVDPEILGKVFETLLEGRDRKQSGSFYTPRVIVAYMCQEALAGYLVDSAKIDRDLIRAQFDPDNADRLTPEQAEAIDRALDTLTVLDPAVGSGSFLIGMLTEIIHLRRVCAIALNVDLTPALLTDWKEAIIRDTLYGVDIKPEVIEIAQLRLWLALIADQPLDQARPLPNLDYKLMAGNSLIETIDGEPVLGLTAEELIDSADGKDADGVPILPYQTNMLGDAVQVKMDLFATQKAVADERIKLDQLRNALFRAKPDECEELRARIIGQERRIVYASLHEKAEQVMAQIDVLGKKAARPGGLLRVDRTRLETLSARLTRLTDLESDLQNTNRPLPFFLYRMHFHEVFARKGGFDVVIANPPYVRHQRITAQKPELQAAYPEVYVGTADLYVYFYARGLRLARPNGTLIYLTQNKFLCARYGKRLRNHLRHSVTIDALIDFGDLPLFDAAAYPLIVALKKTAPAVDHAIRALTVTDMAAVRQIVKTSRGAFALPQAALTDSEWLLSIPTTRALMDKLRAAGKPLGEYVHGEIYCGTKTGFNAAFVIDGAKRAELIAADPKSADIIKPWIRGRDITRWRVSKNDQYIINARHGIPVSNYPAIYDHLVQYDAQLQRRTGTHQWFEFRAEAAELSRNGGKARIVYPDIAKAPRFTIDDGQDALDGTAFGILSDDLVLLALLNSRVLEWFFLQFGTFIFSGYLRFPTNHVQHLPIPTVSDALRTQISALAEACLAAAPDRPDRLPGLESQLNALVYQAYGLTEAEIQIVEGIK